MYGDSNTPRRNRESVHASGRFTVNAWYTFDVPSCRTELFVATDISHDAFRRKRCGSACHTLYGSGAPSEPAVVSATRTLVFADRAVRMPCGSPEPLPRVSL